MKPTIFGQTAEWISIPTVSDIRGVWGRRWGEESTMSTGCGRYSTNDAVTWSTKLIWLNTFQIAYRFFWRIWIDLLYLTNIAGGFQAVLTWEGPWVGAMQLKGLIVPVSSGPWASVVGQARPASIKSQNSVTSSLWCRQTTSLSYSWHRIGQEAARPGPTGDCHLYVSSGKMGLGVGGRVPLSALFLL